MSEQITQTSYKEICLTVSKKLNIPYEEVIRQVENYSNHLDETIRELRDIRLEFFGMGFLEFRYYRPGTLRTEFNQRLVYLINKIKSFRKAKTRDEMIFNYAGQLYEGGIQQAILDYLEKHGSATPMELARYLGFDKALDFRVTTLKLLKDNKIKVKGIKKGAKYYLNT